MIAWDSLIFLFLNIELRVRFWIDFIQAGIKPIRDLEALLIIARAGIISRAKQNSQQKGLAKLLADLTDRSIVITTLVNSNLNLTIYKREEGQPPLYIRKRSETSDPKYIYKRSETIREVDFIVSVSGNYTEALTRLIKAVVNRVKMAGKKYKIEFEDITITP
jgi:hypothetical protein